MPYLAAVATKEWCFKEERVLNAMLLNTGVAAEIYESVFLDFGQKFY